MDSATKDVHAIKYKMSKAKERCMAYFRSLHSHLQVLSKEYLKGTRIEHGFKRAFMSLFDQDVDTFTSIMLLNVDQLQKQLDKDEFQEDGSMEAFWVVKHFKDTLLQHMGNVKKTIAERTRHQRQYDRRVNKRQMQTQESKIDTGIAVDANLVVTESSGIESEVQDDSSRSGNHTDADDAYIRPIYAKSQGLRSKTIEQTTSLLANNADLKYQIQEKVFAIAALKNDLRKLKENSVDTKFAKTSILGKPVLQSLRNQSVVRQPNAFKSERPQMSKQWFASQVDVNNNLSILVTQHYLPKRRESVFAKPNHMIASSESRNCSKNMPRFSSNDMVHNHYLDEARKKTQERDRNSKTSVTPSARFQSTTDGSKPKPRSNNQTPRSLPIITGHRFSPNKTSAVYEKTSPRSDLRWKPTGRIFKTVGLRWVPTGKIHASCTSKVDTEPPHGSNVDIPNIHECKQTLESGSKTVTTSNELDLLFSPMFDEYFNGENKVVLKSSTVTTTDAFDKRQQQRDSTSSTSTLATTFTADGNFDSSAVTAADVSVKRQQQPDSTSSTLTLATTVTADGNFDL
ncbi:hypothetical protein Tco_0341191 [Tanacetum coccineum]